MPTYDPKGNRPKPTRVSDEATPIDAILGPPPEATASHEGPKEQVRPQLSVVPPSENPEPSSHVADSDEPGLADRSSGVPTPVVIVAVAAAALLVVIAIRSRRE